MGSDNSDTSRFVVHQCDSATSAAGCRSELGAGGTSWEGQRRGRRCDDVEQCSWFWRCGGDPRFVSKIHKRIVCCRCRDFRSSSCDCSWHPVSGWRVNRGSDLRGFAAFVGYRGSAPSPCSWNTRGIPDTDQLSSTPVIGLSIGAAAACSISGWPVLLRTGVGVFNGNLCRLAAHQPFDVDRFNEDGRGGFATNRSLLVHCVAQSRPRPHCGCTLCCVRRKPDICGSQSNGPHRGGASERTRLDHGEPV